MLLLRAPLVVSCKELKELKTHHKYQNLARKIIALACTQKHIAIECTYIWIHTTTLSHIRIGVIPRIIDLVILNFPPPPPPPHHHHHPTHLPHSPWHRWNLPEILARHHQETFQKKHSMSRWYGFYYYYYGRACRAIHSDSTPLELHKTQNRPSTMCNPTLHSYLWRIGHWNSRMANQLEKDLACLLSC